MAQLEQKQQERAPTATDDPGSEAHVALLHRTRESQDRLRALRRETNDLEIVRDGLQREQRSLAEKLAQATQRGQHLAQEAEDLLQRRAEIEKQALTIHREVTALERQVSDNDTRTEEINRQIRLEEAEIADLNKALTTAGQGLESGRSTLVRMHQRLALDTLKREGTPLTDPDTP